MKPLNETNISPTATHRFTSHPRTSTLTKIHGLCTRRWLLVLSLVGASSVMAMPALAQPKTKRTAKGALGKVAVTNPVAIRDNKLKVLNARLLKARSAMWSALEVVSSYPVFGLQGTIERGTGQDTQIYGQAFGAEHTPANAMGWATDKKFLTIRGYRRSDVQMDMFSGTYMAVSQTEYVPVPAAYTTALDTYKNRLGVVESIEAEIAAIRGAERLERQQIAQAQQARIAAVAAARSADEKRRISKEAQTTIAGFKARFAKLESATNNPDANLEYSEAALALYRQKMLQHPSDLKLYEPLRDIAVIQNVKAATQIAARGDLEQSGELLVRTLWPTTIQSGEASVAIGSVYSAQSFGAPAQSVFNRQSALLGQLLAAWSVGFPLYAKEAPYAEMVQIRKLGEVLARSAGSYSLPQSGALLARLNQKAVDDTTTAAETTAAQLPNQPVIAEPVARAPRAAALDFQFRNVETRSKYKLSDFRGKVVVLLLGEFQSDDAAAGPSRIERFGQFAKDYDPAKVVFLCVIPEIKPATYLQQLLEERTDPKRSQSGKAVRKYPDLYSMTSNDAMPEQRTREFYSGIEHRFGGNRVTVIDGAGQVVGATEFVEDVDLTEMNERKDRKSRANTRQTAAYEFDKDALDALVIEALTPAK